MNLIGKKLFVLTGAGISAESGIPTFRGEGGLWNNCSIEDVASPRGWKRDPDKVWRFYRDLRKLSLESKPNAAHLALSKRQHQDPSKLFLCTQNIDNLHESAGSTQVHHMHGYLLESRCSTIQSVERRTGKTDQCRIQDIDQDDLPRCSCGSRVRPNICWFSEIPYGMDTVDEQLASSEVFVCVGSSGSVYPAAGLVKAARFMGIERLYVGPEYPDNGAEFSEYCFGKAGDILPNILGVNDAATK